MGAADGMLIDMMEALRVIAHMRHVFLQDSLSLRCLSLRGGRLLERVLKCSFGMLTCCLRFVGPFAHLHIARVRLIQHVLKGVEVDIQDPMLPRETQTVGT